MKPDLTKQSLSTLTRRMTYVAAAVIVLMPFHAFLSIWLSSLAGHYTAIRLWKEVVLAGLVAGLVYLVVAQPRVRAAFRRERLMWLIGGYILLLLLIGLVAFGLQGVSAKAFAYGLLLDTRFLVFFVVTWTITQYNDLLVRFWRQLLLLPAAVAVGFATLQYSLLPGDFLRHFGYGPDTIAPASTVDQKDAYQRIQSTLRGANPFGAYLVLVLSALGALLLRARSSWWRHAVLFGLSGLALVFTFSRSAWIGTAVSLALLMWLSVRSSRMKQGLIIISCTGLVAFAAVGYVLRDNDHFQNVFFHTNEHSRSAESSNSGHFRAIADGLDDIIRSPWGEGTGTAGPASVYNTVPGAATRIAENYYVQVGQEAGVVGMALFAAINVLVAIRLWARRQHPLALVLLVSFAGITAINMLSHAWTDDTLAYIWWGLAGAMLAPGLSLTQERKDETTK